MKIIPLLAIPWRAADIDDDHEEGLYDEPYCNCSSREVDGRTGEQLHYTDCEMFTTR